MDIESQANDLSWVLNDIYLDLISAVSMGREVLSQEWNFVGGDVKHYGRLRVCNNSIFLSLTKLGEVHSKYGKLLGEVPVKVRDEFNGHVAHIGKLRVRELRNAHVAHILEKKAGSPISVSKYLEIMRLAIGEKYEYLPRFYHWICPEKPLGEESLIGCVQSLIEACKTVAGKPCVRR